MKASFSINDIDKLIRRHQADIASATRTVASTAYANRCITRLEQAKEMLLAGKSEEEAWRRAFA